jgi:hypothetical protein
LEGHIGGSSAFYHWNGKLATGMLYYTTFYYTPELYSLGYLLYRGKKFKKILNVEDCSDLINLKWGCKQWCT